MPKSYIRISGLINTCSIYYSYFTQSDNVQHRKTTGKTNLHITYQANGFLFEYIQKAVTPEADEY